MFRFLLFLLSASLLLAACTAAPTSTPQPSLVGFSPKSVFNAMVLFHQFPHLPETAAVGCFA